MDFSPFANTNPQTMAGTPDYLKQNPRANASAPGALSNMVKAIMDGNNKFQQRGGALSSMTGGAPGGAVPGAAGPTSFGGSAGPMPLAPSPTTPSGMSGPTPSTPTASGSGNAGAMPFGSGVPVASPEAPPVNGAGPGFKSAAGWGAGVPFDSGAAPMDYAPAPGMMQTNGWGSGLPGMPNGPDKTMSALFSQIPGGMFGG